jgi:hypothetical protein
MRKATRTLPKFAKRHYEALAQVIQSLALSHNELSNDELDELVSVRQGIANDFANMLAKDNPRFDRARFIQACIPGNNVRVATKPAEDVSKGTPNLDKSWTQPHLGRGFRCGA